MTEEQKRRLKRVLVGLIGAASAYETYAQGDNLKSTRVRDFKRHSEDARKLAVELGLVETDK